MAVKFVRSGASGAGTGADWTNAYTTLNAALTAMAAGDTAWVADDHAESTAGTVTLPSPGTTANPCFIYCVDHNQASPGANDLKTSATVAASGGNTIQVNGSAYIYGIQFNSSNGIAFNQAGTGIASVSWQRLDSCLLNTTSVGSGAVFIFGAISGSTNKKLELINTPMKFGAVGQGIQVGDMQVTWRNTSSAIQGSVPTTLFVSSGGIPTTFVCEGVDLSAAGSGKTLVGNIASPLTVFFKDCAFGASVTVSATQTSGPAGATVYVTRSDSAATNYRAEKYGFQGSQVVETTIVRSGGASDGTTPVSWKLVTTARPRWAMPYEALPIAIWNDTTGSPITLTVEGVASALPNNDDIWLEVEYLGSSSNPQGSFANNTKANNLATGTALNASTSTWASSPGFPFKLSVTITPQMKGPITLYVRAAKVSATLYVDPLVTVS